MMASLVILGYAFYMDSRLFWSYKAEKGPLKWIYGLSTAFIFITYFLFALVLFAFMTETLTSFSLMNLVNTVLSIFLVAGAGLIAAIMKYHFGTMQPVEIGGMKRKRKKS